MGYIKKNKRAQMNLSFGVIFSIILIIVFIAFAIFGVAKLMQTVQESKVLAFKNDLQTAIDAKWQGEYGSTKFEGYLPKKITKVCFIDDEFENIYFLPIGKFKGGELKHLDFSKIIPSNAQEVCINAADGKIVFYLKKNSGEQLVTITR
jgi:hypothetical protein